MATFIRRRSVEYVTHFELVFHSKDVPGAGYAFPCDEHGKNVTFAPFTGDMARANCARLMAGEMSAEYHDGVVESRESRIVHEAIIECMTCRRHVTLWDAMTNYCDCGAMYNGSGQRLAPVRQWGEETGEHWADILQQTHGGLDDGD